MEKKVLLFLSALILTFFTKSSSAQGTFTGCMANNSIYQNAGDNNIYNDSPKIILSTNYCSWAAIGMSSPCTICVGGLNGAGKCPGSHQQLPGVSGTFIMVKCPIDETFFFFGFGVLLSFFSIRELNTYKRKLLKA